VPTHDDARRLAQSDVLGKSIDDVVAERLAPARQAADYGRLFARLDGVAKPDDACAVLACDVCGPEAIAVAFLDNIAAAKRFIDRFRDEHVPSLWSAGSTVVLTAWPLDLEDGETAERLRDLPRGRWLLRDDREPNGLRDPAIRPHAAGAARAARRRGEAR
jgi:hypothetical protein